MKRILIAGFIGLVVLALGWRLVTDLERYEKTVHRPPSRAAREDPYLAFRRWAAANGLILEDGGMEQAGDYDIVVYDLQRYDPDDTFFYVSDQLISEGRHLCFIVPSLLPDTGIAADFLEPYLKAAGFDIGITETGWQSSEASPLMRRSTEIGRISTGQNIVFTAEGLPGKAEYVRDDDGVGYLFLSLPSGRGRLTLTGDPQFLMNHRIGEADNAELAWRLFSGTGAGQRVLFLVGPAADSRMGSNPWVPWIGASWLAALVLLVWSGSGRPDSLLAGPPPVGSDIGRRLAAEGEFLRKHGGTSGYTEAGRTAARRKPRRGGWENPLDPKALAEISRLTGADPDDLVLALGDRTSLSPAEYLRAARTYHQIEAEL